MSWLWGSSCPDLARAWPNLGVINHWGLRFQSSALCRAGPALPSFSSPFLEHLEGSRDPDLPAFDTTICIRLFENQPCPAPARGSCTWPQFLLSAFAAELALGAQGAQNPRAGAGIHH